MLWTWPNCRGMVYSLAFCRRCCILVLWSQVLWVVDNVTDSVAPFPSKVWMLTFEQLLQAAYTMWSKLQLDMMALFGSSDQEVLPKARNARAAIKVGKNVTQCWPIRDKRSTSFANGLGILRLKRRCQARSQRWLAPSGSIWKSLESLDGSGVQYFPSSYEDNSKRQRIPLPLFYQHLCSYKIPVAIRVKVSTISPSASEILWVATGIWWWWERF